MDNIARLIFINYSVNEAYINGHKTHFCFYGRLEDKEEIFLDED